MKSRSNASDRQRRGRRDAEHGPDRAPVRDTRRSGPESGSKPKKGPLSRLKFGAAGSGGAELEPPSR